MRMFARLALKGYVNAVLQMVCVSARVKPAQKDQKGDGE